MAKNFVLDTNILLHSPDAMITAFDDNNVILTGTTLQELDAKKTAGGEIGYNARECCRILDGLREQGDLRAGVPLDNGGTIRIEPNGIDDKFLPKGFSSSSPDNRIISTCIYLHEIKKKEIILVTEDISLRINASICGIPVETYRNSQVKDSGYTGHRTMETENYGLIEGIYSDGTVDVEDQNLMENEFVTLKSGNASALSVYRHGRLELVKKTNVFGHITSLNAMQTYAMWALMQPAEEIPLVILIGPAGTAKTFLSLACGIDQVYSKTYNRVMISRPTARSYEQIGFLKGGLEEKLKPLLDSYYDNMSILLSDGGKESREQVDMHMDDLLESGTVEICGLDFIRGRSLQDTYIICDEAQNASPGLIRDVVTRAGRGSKVILAGDPEQIDVPSLSKRSNGLVYALESMKGSRLAAICTFSQTQSVRSDLSKEAVLRMKI